MKHSSYFHMSIDYIISLFLIQKLRINFFHYR
nr:MAG TPA: hypothetical protein [Caudoviricetes sp.]